MTGTNSAPRKPYDNPRYSRNARATIAKWHGKIFPIAGLTEEILVSRKDHEMIHFLYELIRDVLEHCQAIKLAVIDENRDLSKADRIKAEAEAQAPLATFADEMKAAHRADWQDRQDRRTEREAPAAERATG